MSRNTINEEVTDQITNNNLTNVESSVKTERLLNIEANESQRTDQNNEIKKVNEAGIWLNPKDWRYLNKNKKTNYLLETLKSNNINILFLHERALIETRTDALKFIKRSKYYDVEVHIWIQAFNDGNGFKNPYYHQYTVKNITKNKKYTRTVQKPYYVVVAKKTYYSKKKVKYKKWYKKRNRWVYTWKTKTKRVKKIKKITEKRYKTVNETFITKEVVGSQIIKKDSTYIKNIKSRINDYTKISDVKGIHLDYLRYPGNAYKTKNGTKSINEFTKSVKDIRNKNNPKIKLSAAIMPECENNIIYYGQDSKELGKHLDYIIPMVYRSSYNQNTQWITKVSKYFKENSDKAKVLTGLSTYRGEKNTERLEVAELKIDTQSAMKSCVYGVAFFRWGLMNLFNVKNI